MDVVLHVVRPDIQGTLARAFSAAGWAIRTHQHIAGLAPESVAGAKAAVLDTRIEGAPAFLDALAETHPGIVRVTVGGGPTAGAQHIDLAAGPESLGAVAARLLTRDRATGAEGRLARLAREIAADIRAPLRSIAGLSRTVARSLPSGHPASAELVEIEQATREAGQALGGLVALTGPQDRASSVIDVAALLRQSVAQLCANSRREVRVLADVTAPVSGNPQRLLQALATLVAEVDRAAAEKGAICVALRHEAGRALIEIGLGATPGKRVPLDAAAARYWLAAADEIISEHSGRLLAEPTQRPARFTVSLPLFSEVQVA